jgi:MinD superfamily P-loop ATPase
MDIWELPIIDLTKCDGCMLCVKSCPTKAVVPFEGLPRIVSEKDCEYCGICEDTCPRNAIYLEYFIVPRYY